MRNSFEGVSNERKTLSRQFAVGIAALYSCFFLSNTALAGNRGTETEAERIARHKKLVEIGKNIQPKGEDAISDRKGPYSSGWQGTSTERPQKDVKKTAKPEDLSIPKKTETKVEKPEINKIDEISAPQEFDQNEVEVTADMNDLERALKTLDDYKVVLEKYKLENPEDAEIKLGILKTVRMEVINQMFTVLFKEEAKILEEVKKETEAGMSLVDAMENHKAELDKAREKVREVVEKTIL